MGQVDWDQFGDRRGPRLAAPTGVFSQKTRDL
jgi:hypothetical protein